MSKQRGKSSAQCGRHAPEDSARSLRSPGATFRRCDFEASHIWTLPKNHMGLASFVNILAGLLGSVLEVTRLITYM